MKTKIRIGTAIVCMIISACTSKQKESHFKQEVKMEIVNGKEKLTVSTTIDGETTTEVYEGQRALDKLDELDREKRPEAEERNQKTEKDVKIRIDETGKTVTIRTSEGDKRTEEVYTGEEADKQLKALEKEGTQERDK